MDRVKLITIYADLSNIKAALENGEGEFGETPLVMVTELQKRMKKLMEEYDDES